MCASKHLARGPRRFLERRHRLRALYENSAATVSDLREAMRTVEETDRAVRHVLGDAHPLATTIELDLRHARAALRARETPP